MSDADVGAWVRQVAQKAMAEQVHAWQRYGELVRRLSSGALDEQALRDEVVRFSRDETARYARAAAAVALSCSDALLDLERARTDAFFDGVLGAGGFRANGSPVSGTPADGPAVPPAPPDLVLAGRRGEAAEAALLVDNAEDAPIELVFAVSDFVPADGGPPFRPPLEIAPERVTLAPGGSARVVLSLPLDPDLFAVGRATATLRARGRDDLDVVLAVDVGAAAPREDDGGPVAPGTVEARAAPD